MSDIKKIILDTPTQELENIISPFIREQFPSFIRADHHKLILFIKSYYEWLEKKDNPGYVLAKLDTVGDIDNNAEEFYSHFKNTYMDSFPEIMAINSKGESPNKMTLLKKISEFYKNKGTESAYKFLFRLLYDSDLEIYYPKEDILRVSSGVWTEPRSVKTTSSSSRDIFKTVNGTLTQYDPADPSIIIASAFIDDVVRYSSNGLPITEFFLRQISGVFLPDTAVTAMSGTTSYTERTYSVLGEFFIETAGTGYTVGDALFISSSGTGFAAKVSVTGLAGSIKRISIENSGVNYFTEVEAIVISSVGGNTATRIVLKPTAITNYPGYFSGNKGKISSNKKIQDGHYYQEFSYALKSSISFDKYFSVLKALTHPSGMRMFGEILQQSNLGMTPIPFSQYKILDTPIIGNYTPYRFETVLNLRANGAISSTGYTSGVGYLTWMGLSGAVLGGTNQDDSSEIISTINNSSGWGRVGAISTQNYLDDIEVNASAPILTSAFVGLNRNQPASFASDEAYREIDYSWQFVAFAGNGYAAACINGEQQNINQIGGFERSADSTLPRNSTDIFTIRYEGGNINWFKNRNLILSRVAMEEYVTGITLHAQVAIEPQYNNINKVQNLSFVDRQGNTAAAGDLYPAGYNPYISFPSVAINGISSPQGTLFVDVGLSGGYTYAVMPENGITTHNTLGNPLGSSASWRTGIEGINDQTIAGIPGKVLWLKPEGLLSLSGGSAAGASLARWTDASGEGNHGILPTWDRWNDTLVYGKKTENTTGWNQSLFNTNPATTVEWRVGHYGPPIQGMSFASDPSNLQVVGFWAEGCCGGLTLNGNTFADGPLGTGGNTMDGGRMRLDAAWYASTTNAGLPSIEFVELGRGVSASATVVASIPATYTTNSVFGVCFDETNRKVNAYIDGVVYRSQIGIPTGTTFYIDSSIYGLSANIEILKADFRGVPINTSGWTSTNGVTFSVVTGSTMEFLAPTIVKNDSAVGRDGLRFNGDLILSPHLLWLGQTGSINSIRSNPEMNFVRGNPGTEATLQGSHFYLTRGLSLAADMEVFIVCRNSSDDYYSGRWFVGSHRKFQGNTYDIVFSHTSFNAADRDISLSGSTAYYRAAIVSPITGATALAYDHNTGLVGFRPAGPNITGVQKTLAYDPHVSLSSVGTSVGEWSRAEDFTINSFFNGDSSRNISPSTGRYRSTETLPYKIEYAGFTSGHLLEIGRFGNGPIESISTLAGKNWLEEVTLTYTGDGGLTAVGLVATYSKKYKGKISYDVVVGAGGNAYLQYNSDFNSLTGSDTPSKDWTFSAYLKREDAAAINTVLVNLLPASGSPDSFGIGTTTPVGDGWYHVKRSIVGQTLGGLAPTGVTLDLVGFYTLSPGMTYTISGAVLEKHKEYAPIGSTAWAEAVSADSKYGFEGDINEILVFNRKLNEDERQTVYGYISKKYSLSDALPNSFGRSHPSAQRVGTDYWEIRHHPNTTAIVDITMYSAQDTLITPTTWQYRTSGVMPTTKELPTGFSDTYVGGAGENSLVLGYTPWGAQKNLWQAQNTLINYNDGALTLENIYQVDADFSRSMFSTHFISNNGSNPEEWNDWTDTTIATYQGTPYPTGTRAYPWENDPERPRRSSPWHNIIYETCIGSYNWGARAFFLYCPFGSFNQSWFLTPEIYKRTYTAADSSGTAHDQPAIWKGFNYAIQALLEGTLTPVNKTAMDEPSNVMIYHPSVRGYYQYRNSSNAFWDSLPGSTDEKKDAQFYEYLDAWIDDLISMKASTSNGGRLHITLDAVSPSATPSDIELWRSMPDYKTDALELSDWYIFDRLVAAGIPTFYESRSVISRNQAIVPDVGSGVAGATLAVEWAGKAFTGEEYWFWYSNPTNPSINSSFSNHVSDEDTSMVFRLASANFPIPSDRDPFGLTKTATSNGRTKTFTTNDKGNAFTPQFAMSHHYMMSDHYRKFYNENTDTRTFTGVCAKVKNIISYTPSLICGTNLTTSVYNQTAVDPLLKYWQLPASTVAYRPAFNSGTAPGEWNHAGGVNAYMGGYWVASGKTAWDTNVRDATLDGFLSKLHAYSLLVGPSSEESRWDGFTYGTIEDTLTNDVIVLMPPSNVLI